jgi:hypothetical protein
MPKGDFSSPVFRPEYRAALGVTMLSGLMLLQAIAHTVASSLS